MSNKRQCVDDGSYFVKRLGLSKEENTSLASWYDLDPCIKLKKKYTIGKWLVGTHPGMVTRHPECIHVFMTGLKVRKWCKGTLIWEKHPSICSRIIHRCRHIVQSTLLVDRPPLCHCMFKQATLNTNNIGATLFSQPVQTCLTSTDALLLAKALKQDVSLYDCFIAVICSLLVDDKYQLTLTGLITRVIHRLHRWKPACITTLTALELRTHICMFIDSGRFLDDKSIAIPMSLHGTLIVADIYTTIMTDIITILKSYMNKPIEPRVPTKMYRGPCAICLNTIQPSERRTLECGHVFHSDCAETWFNISKSCPMCRAVQSNYKSPSVLHSPMWDMLTNEQQQAVRASINNDLSVIIGAGGTGKTQVAQVIGDSLYLPPQEGSDIDLKCIFVAPTGKAADVLGQRLGEKFTVTTIHRWILGSHLSYAPVLLLDEAGMVNLWLMWHLLQTAEERGVQRLVLMGDPHQLPPIYNDGTVLDAFYHLSQCPYRHELTINHRSNTGIQRVLEHIRQVADGTITTGIDFSLFDEGTFLETHRNNHEQLYTIILPLIKDPSTTKVITALKYPLMKPGLHNKKQVQLLNRFNHSPDRTGWSSLVVGDHVISTVNTTSQTEIKTLNGMDGHVKSMDPFTVTFRSNYTASSERNSDQKIINGLQHATIMTVHKFQGSEEDTIIAVFVGGFPLSFFNVQLLYTAISRARKRVVVIMDKQTRRHYETNPTHVKRNEYFNRLLSIEMKKHCT